MNTHKNARLTPYSRGGAGTPVLEDGQTPKVATAALSVSTTTFLKWVTYFRAEGLMACRTDPPDPTIHIAV